MGKFTLGTKMADTAIVELIDVGTGEVLVDSKGKKMFIEVYGSDSRKYRTVLANVVSANENKRAGKKTNDAILTEVLANCIASWNIEIDGAELPLTVGNAIDLFEESRPIREQIIDVQNERKFFLIK